MTKKAMTRSEFMDEARRLSAAHEAALSAFLHGKRLPKGWSRLRDDDDYFLQDIPGTDVNYKRPNVSILPPGGVLGDDEFMIAPVADQNLMPSGKFQVMYSDGGSIGEPVAEFKAAINLILDAQNESTPAPRKLRP